MASFLCHAFAVTKQVRLERIVRRQPEKSAHQISVGSLKFSATKLTLELLLRHFFSCIALWSRDDNDAVVDLG